MRLRWTTVILLAACRIHFDPVALSDGAADDSADGTDGTTGTDAMVAVCHTGAWSTPTPLTVLNTPSEEADPAVSPDELTLYFTSNRSPSMGRALWVTTRPTRTSAFVAPTYLTALDSPVDELDVAILGDGLTVMLTSNRAGSYDIFVATRPTLASQFGTPTALPMSGAPGAMRSSPSLSGDELELYYASGLDVAVARRMTTSDNFAFVRILSELNVPQTDGNPSITADGLEIFYDSYRTGVGATFRGVRTARTLPFDPPVELTELATVTGAQATGTPIISADGQTLYLYVRVSNQLDLFTSTRSCP